MRPLSMLLLFVCIILSSGCENLLSNRYEPTGELNSSILEKDSSVSPLACAKDSDGNAIKVIVCKHDSPLWSDQRGTELLRRAPMMQRSFLFQTGNERYHAGPNPRLRGEGWFDATDVYLTSSMQLVRLNTDNRMIRRPVVGFASAAELEAFLRGGNVQPSLVESRLGVATGDDWMPILESKKIQVGESQMQIIQLGAWTLSTTRKAPNKRVDPRELQNNMKQVRIVLVVDATASMHLAWETLRKHLSEIVERALSTDLAVQIAIVAYRDDDENSKWRQRASAFTADVNTLANWISKMKPEAGGDWRERMLEGVEKAAEMLSRPEHSHAYKAILLCADNAGHADDDYPLIGSVGKRAVDRCEKYGITISSLQVPYHPKFTGDKRLLPQQLDALTKATSGRQFQLSENETNTAAAAKKIVSALVKNSDDAKIEAAIANEINEGRGIDEIREQTGLPESVFVWHVENVHRRTDGRLKIEKDAYLGVDKVWVAFQPEAFVTGVLIPSDDLDQLIHVLDRLVTVSADKPTSLATLWGELATRNSGEDIPLSEALRVQDSLPVRDNLLGLTLSELVVMPRSQRQAWAREVEKKFAALVAWRDANKPSNGSYVIPSSVLP